MIGVSSAAAMALVVDHVLARTARKIASIGGNSNEDTKGVGRRGYLAAMARHGLEPGPQIPIHGPSTIGTGAQAMRELLAQGPDMDAVTGVFDFTSFGALAECQRRGVLVPEDLSIAGFGAPESSTLSCPSLTIVDPHSAEIGRRAGMLVADLRGETTAGAAAIRLEIAPWLQIGQSSGCEPRSQPPRSR